MGMLSYRFEVLIIGLQVLVKPTLITFDGHQIVIA